MTADGCVDRRDDEVMDGEGRILPFAYENCHTYLVSNMKDVTQVMWSFNDIFGLFSRTEQYRITCDALISKLS